MTDSPKTMPESNLGHMLTRTEAALQQAAIRFAANCGPLSAAGAGDMEARGDLADNLLTALGEAGLDIDGLLSSPDRPIAMVVKDLEWEDGEDYQGPEGTPEGYPYSSATGAGCIHYFVSYNGAWGFTRHPSGGSAYHAEFREGMESFEEAKAKAQEDFERIMLSGLNPAVGRTYADGMQQAAAIAEHFDGKYPKSDVVTQHKIAEAIRAAWDEWETIVPRQPMPLKMSRPQARDLVTAWLDETEAFGSRRERLLETARATPSSLEAWLIAAVEIGLKAAADRPVPETEGQSVILERMARAIRDQNRTHIKQSHPNAEFQREWLTDHDWALARAALDAARTSTVTVPPLEWHENGLLTGLRSQGPLHSMEIYENEGGS